MDRNGSTDGPVSPLRRLAAFAISHGMGMLAYSIVSPAIVLYTFLSLAAVGFAVLGAGVEQDGSLVQTLVFAVLAIGDGAIVELLWRPELSLEQNALRLFGGVGVALWLVELVTSPLRRGDVRPREGAWERFKSFFRRMAIFTVVLSTVLLVSVLVIQTRDPGLTLGFVLHGAFSAYGMGFFILLFSAPALAAWFWIQAARRPVAAAVMGQLAPAGPAPRADPTSPGARTSGAQRPPGPPR